MGMRKGLLIFAGMAAALGIASALALNGPQGIGDIIARVRPDPDAGKAPAPRAPKATAKKQPIVMSVRIGSRGTLTRFVIEMSDPVTVRTFTLAAPNRVVIDLPAVQWNISGSQTPAPGSAIRGYRYGLFRPDNSRFVIDLAKPATPLQPTVVPPQNGYGYRLIVDLVSTTQGAFDRTAGWPADLKARERAAERIAAVAPLPTGSKVKTIVIDPGHGGIDDGTVGKDGTKEKDIVLAECTVLKAALKARGYRVYVTHEDDSYVALPRRVAFARAHRADLFVSVHADSIHDPKISGLSVYTLSEKGSDEEASALAAKENLSDTLAGVDLSGGNAAVAPILIDLAQRDTLNKSSRFAESALAALRPATSILARQPHRSAALVVLKAPDVPAVLIELGYLSNTADRERMKTAPWRKAVAGAIARAVDRYFADPAGTRTAPAKADISKPAESGRKNKN
jgi:N-acetylmuramoyl-L-alanine amidase